MEPSTETQSASQPPKNSLKKSPKKYPKHARVEPNNLMYSPPTDHSTNKHNIIYTSTTPVDLSVLHFSKNIPKTSQNNPNVFKFGKNNTTSQNKPSSSSYHLNDPSIISIIHNPSTTPKNKPTQNAPTPGKSAADLQNTQDPAVALQNGLVPSKTLANIKITVCNDQRSIQTEEQQKEVQKPSQNNLFQSRSLALETQGSQQPQFQAQASQSKPFAPDTSGHKQRQSQAQTSQSRPFASDTLGPKQPQIQAQTSQSRPSAFNTLGFKQPQFQAQKSRSRPSAFNTKGFKQPEFQTQTSQSRPFAPDTSGHKQRQSQAQTSQSRPFASDTLGPKQPQIQVQTSQSRPFAFDTQGFKRPQFQAQTSQSQAVVRSSQKPVVGRESARPTWRAKKPYYYEEQDVERKVIVTGFPAYTQSQELSRKLSVLGSPQVQICKNRVAVVLLGSPSEAAAALRASDTIPMYGAILTILKYTSREHVFEMIRQNKRVVKFEHKGPPPVEPSSIDLSGHFQQQLQNLEDAIRLTPAEVEAIGPLFHDIETYLCPLYPDCQAVPFGSITTGQGIKSSDADCFLALEPGEDGRPGAGAAEHSSHFVSGAVRVLRQHKDIFTNLVSIPRANTPIIKFLHVPTNVNCDLNSKTPLGVQNSRLVGHLLGLDPRLGSAALVLKYWARLHSLSGTGRLTNYALIMLLIHYLQQSLLPPVADLQGPAHRFIIESWDAGFSRAPLPYLREVPPVQDLLGGFLLYYSTFNFDDLVVCPLLGKPLTKVEFETKKLPEAMGLYCSNISSGLAYPLRTGCAMCVQDPFELSHNVASAVSGKLAADIQATLKWAAAAYTQPEKIPGDFLRTILLGTRPSDALPDTRLSTKVSLPRGLLDGLGEGEGDGDWRDTARAAVLDCVYRDILLVPLQRIAAVSREAGVETEVYFGSLSRPVWRRGAHGNARVRSAHMLTARHRQLTEDIVRGPAPDVHVPFEVELGFSSAPRRLTVSTTAADGADMEAFRLFRLFAHNFIHRWCKTLLTPDTAPASNGAPGEATKQQIRPAKKNYRDNKKLEMEKLNSLEESANTAENPTSNDGKPSSTEETSNPQEEKTKPLEESKINSHNGSREVNLEKHRKVSNYPGKGNNAKQNSTAPGTPDTSLSAPVQINSVAFVNSQHKEISASLAGISLVDGARENDNSS